MRVYVASKNAGKIRELQALFAPAGWELRTYEGYADPVEGEASYADNAALKARALAAQLSAAGITAPALGDDSGLEVTVLDGRPGVLSARYGGAEAPWAERRRMLLEEIAASGRADRSARFVCALHLVAEEGREYAVFEALPGEIAACDQGVGGFSYDPIFTYPPVGKTFGELSDVEKNAVSHRALAARALLRAWPRGSEA